MCQNQRHHHGDTRSPPSDTWLALLASSPVRRPTFAVVATATARSRDPSTNESGQNAVEALVTLANLERRKWPAMRPRISTMSALHLASLSTGVSVEDRKSSATPGCSPEYARDTDVDKQNTIGKPAVSYIEEISSSCLRGGP